MEKATAKKITDEVRSGYDGIAASFSATRNRPWPEMTELLELVKPGDRVLDVGCGNGRALAALGGKAVDYVGVDASGKLIDIARHAHAGPLAEFHVTDAAKLPFDDADFDVVMLFAVMHHVPGRELRSQAMCEAYRVLRPGGILLMTNWNFWQPRFWKIFFRSVESKLRGSGLDWGDVRVPWRGGGERHDRYCHAFTLHGIRQLAESTGLGVIRNNFSSKMLFSRFRSGNIVTVCRKPLE